MTESIRNFAERISKDVGCYFTENKSNYNLKKYNTSKRGRMGVFAWIHERKKGQQFWITTYKYLADDKAITDADIIKEGMHFISKKKDVDGIATGLIYYISKGSNGSDYQRATRALRKICQSR